MTYYPLPIAPIAIGGIHELHTRLTGQAGILSRHKRDKIHTISIDREKE